MANCMNCGAPIEEGAVFCRNCGAKLDAAAPAAPAMEAPVEAAPAAPAMETPAQEPVMAPMDASLGAATFASGAMQPDMAGAPVQGAPMAGMPEEPKTKKKFPVALVSIIAAVLIIAIVVIVLLVTRKETVSVNQFISLEYSGYDTLGTAEIVFDSDAFEEKYGDKIKYKSGKEDEYLDAIDFLEDVLEDSAYLENDSDLSNGDVVNFTWDIDKKYVEETLKIELDYSNMEFTVEGLTELMVVDPFDSIEVKFEGFDTNGNAAINVLYGDDNFYMSHLWCECDKTYDLSNGDTITITLNLNSWTYDSVEELCYENGYKPFELTKTYTVEGLTELQEIDIFDYVTVTFSGIDGDGYADASLDYDNAPDCFADMDLSIDYDYRLTNGDTIVVTPYVWWNDVDDYLVDYGYIPKTMEKSYTVSGLGSYVVSVDQLPDDFFATVDAAGRALFAEQEVQYWSEKMTMKSMELQNAYLLTYMYDDYWYNVGPNGIALIYKNILEVTEDDEVYPVEFYSTVWFETAILAEDGTVTVGNSNAYVDYGYYSFDAGYNWYSVTGFATYEEAYDDFVGYYADSYNVTEWVVDSEEVVEPEYVDEDGDGIDDVTGETIPTEEVVEPEQVPADITEDLTGDTVQVGDGELVLTFELPKGFVEESAGMYKHESGDYLSNINIMTVGNDGSFYTFTEEAIYAEVETALKEQMGEDVEIELVEFEELLIGENDAVGYVIAYEYLGYAITQAQVVVDDPDEFIYITYTMFDEEGYYDAFEESVGSIRYEAK